MNSIQKLLFAIYLPFTILIFFLDNAFPGHFSVIYLKYTLIITLFLVSIVVNKFHIEQKYISVSLFFVVIADFFLTFSDTLPNIKMNTDLFGMAFFMVAYIVLIIAFQKNFRLRKAEIIVAAPLLIVLITVLLSLYSYVKVPMLISAIIFGIVLCYMAWTAICTLFRRYYRRRIAFMIALAGSLIFISDMVVAFGLFHPAYAGTFVPWLKNIIWTTYIPAWTILTAIVSEDRLFEW